jgi:hypothetical protein
VKNPRVKNLRSVLASCGKYMGGVFGSQVVITQKSVVHTQARADLNRQLGSFQTFTRTKYALPNKERVRK